MASLSLRPSLVDYIDSVILAPRQRLEEMVVGPGSWLAGKALSEVGAAHPGVHVLALRRADESELVTSPAADVVLAPGDLAVVLGRVDVLQRLG